MKALPGISRLSYVRDLFAWLRESLAAASTSTVSGYSKISDSLVIALEELGKEVGSVSLLQYVDRLRDVNESIARINNKGDDAEAMNLLINKLPDVRQQETNVRNLCVVRMLIWIAIAVVAAVTFGVIK